MLDLIDRFWVFAQVEPILVGVLILLLLGIIFCCWAFGWRVKNHLMGTALAVALTFVVTTVRERLAQRFRRARP